MSELLASLSPKGPKVRQRRSLRRLSLLSDTSCALLPLHAACGAYNDKHIDTGPAIAAKRLCRS